MLGDGHHATLLSINNMGAILQKQDKLEEAEPYFREVMENSRRVLGDEHPHTLGSINNMGGLLNKQGKLDEAEPYLREALKGYRRVLGDEHPNTLISINNMGVLLYEQEKYEEAEAFAREALKLRPGDKKHQARSRKLLDDIEEARREKAAEDPDPKEEGNPAKTP